MRSSCHLRGQSILYAVVRGVKVSTRQPCCKSRNQSRTVTMAGYQYGQTVVIEPKKTHTASIVFLHGLGDSGQGISNVSQGLNLPHVKFLFPTAPQQPMTCFGGAPARGWFDLYGLDRMFKGERDEVGIQKSIDYVNSLIQKEIDAGIPATRIVIGGFSQGGHISGRYMLQSKHSMPACVMLSTWLEGASGQSTEAGKAAIYWIGHGTNDGLIPPHLSSLAENVLKGQGCRDVRRKVYTGMEHTVSSAELSDLQDFLETVLPAETGPPPTLESIQGMSVKQLREYLKSKHISTTGFLEKQEFLDAAQKTL